MNAITMNLMAANRPQTRRGLWRIARRYAVAACLLVMMPAVGVLADDAPVADEPGESTVTETETQTITLTEANLQPGFVPGRHTRYTVWTLREQTVDMRIGAEQQSVQSSIELNAEVTWTVEQVGSDGSATCLMVIEWMAAGLTLPDGSTQRIDSREPTGQPESAHRTLSAMSGTPLRLQVAADGTVQSIDGVDAIRAQLENGGNVKDLELIESASKLATIPGAPEILPIGQSWPMNFAWSHEMGTVHHQAEYRLEGIENIADIPVATVSAHSRLQLEVDPALLPQNGPPMEVRMHHGQADTQILFDLLRHEAVGRHAVQTQHVEVRVQLPQDTLVRNLHETVYSQLLRISED